MTALCRAWPSVKSGPIALHDPHYSVIANPFALGKQNCTEFVLDVITAAIYQTGDILHDLGLFELFLTCTGRHLIALG